MRLIFVVIIFVCLTGCASSDFEKYEKLVVKELASGKRTDSLFLGIYLGMPIKDFYTHCWEMNKKGIIRDGYNNNYVLYKLDNSKLKHPGAMNFYPDFVDQKIYRMRVLYQYDGWAPWNKPLASDSLLPDILKLYKNWYATGNDFIRIDDPKKGAIYVKVDNNRQITIGRYDDMYVKVDFVDLIVEKQTKK